MKLNDNMLGRFCGTGRWHDTAGATQSYTIDQTNRLTPLGFVLSFEHVFEDATVIRAEFSMVWIAAPLFRLDIEGKPSGNGYVLEDYCHYHLQAGPAFVEASYLGSADGLRVFGSSSKNADGNYIAWSERLRRAG